MRLLRVGLVVAAVAAGGDVAAAPRVTDGLQVLYTFTEGAGAVIHDRSGREPALDLTLADPAKVAWGPGGLAFLEPTIARTAEPAERLAAAIQASGAATIEAWLQTADPEQSGPARIVTMSRDPGARNFTLGQAGPRWDVRFRTTRTGESGTNPSTTGGGPAAGGPTRCHVLYTRDELGRAVVYIDGEPVHRQAIPGDLTNWSHAMRLCLGNEVEADRPWLGELHFVAVYDRALTADEVRRHWLAGEATPADEKTLSHEPLVLYTFAEGAGEVVRDRAPGPPLDLTITDPTAVEWRPGGLRLKAPVRLVSPQAATKISEICAVTGAVSLEAWLTPADFQQTGPARIVSLSVDGSTRNVTLAQERSGLVVRLRTTLNDANGGNPEVTAPGILPRAGARPGELTHVVYTRSPEGIGRIYQDGQLVVENDQIGGELTGWDPTLPLALANELTGDRPWRGRLRLVAIYDRALTAEEIRQHHAAGAP